MRYLFIYAALFHSVKSYGQDLYWAVEKPSASTHEDITWSTKEVPKKPLVEWGVYSTYELNDGIGQKPQVERAPAETVPAKEIPAPIKKSRWDLGVSFVTSNREIQIVDNVGSRATIGGNPSLGVQVETAVYGDDGMGVEVIGQYLRDDYKPDSAITLTQQTDKHIQLLTRLSFRDNDDLVWGFGLGFQTIASVFSVSATELISKHLLTPHVHGYFLRKVYGTDSRRLSLGGSLDYFLGASEGAFELERGYKGALSLQYERPLNARSNVIAGFQFFLQDDKPASYKQTQFGVQLNLGIRWSQILGDSNK